MLDGFFARASASATAVTMPVTRILLVLLVLAAGSMVAGADARAASSISLESGANVKISGAAPGDHVGSSVSRAGDVNGDGIPDVIVGADGASNNGRSASGSAWVIFGTASKTTVNLAKLGNAGFRIDGPSAQANAAWGVAGPGDINGDGLADVVVGVPRDDQNGRSGSGAAYVVYGKRDGAPVDLANLGSAGFRIDGAMAFEGAGSSVAGVGDVNGDGIPDVMVGAPYAPHGDTSAGAAYVVFGKRDNAPVDLATLGVPGVGAPGFRIDGTAANDLAGHSVAGAGDVNGDGIPDVIVGAVEASNNARANSGSAYVVFGKKSTEPVELATFGSPAGSAGFRIDGAAAGDEAGNEVAATGDMNGDGRSDVVVGAPETNAGGSESGSAYVVFGSSSSATVDLAALGTRGYQMNGAGDRYFAWDAVAGGCDVNGDGRPDTLVGAFGRSLWTGSAYAVYGPAATTTITLGSANMAGSTMNGFNQGDNAGYRVDCIGDTNGDGRSDIVVTAPGAGVVYIVLGQ